jgi:hypothetical protein
MVSIKNPVILFCGIIFTTVMLHWSLVQWYSIYCAPPGITGLLQTFLTLGSPICHFVNLTQVELAKHYITIWISTAASIVVWVASKLKI